MFNFVVFHDSQLITTVIMMRMLIISKCEPIVNGLSGPIEPNLGQFPFHASLLQKKTNKQLFSFCGGSLINTKWTLTAAHCIQLDENYPRLKPNEVLVSLGSIYRNGRDGQLLPVEKLFIHPQYLKTGGRHDIGLVQLKVGAKVDGSKVNVIKLHKNFGEDLLGRTAYLTGFGIINDLYQTPVRLREAILHISSYDQCFSQEEFKNYEICASSRIAEGKACKGDSGGPLFLFERNSTFVQIGITSHLALLPICKIFFNHSVYTRVSAYISWVEKVTNIKFK